MPRAIPGEVVLVVDDEQPVRTLVSEILGDLGYGVIEAADGAAGLAAVRSGSRIDLLISDIGMSGGMNGSQMVEAARLERPNLKVLFITGYAAEAIPGNRRLEPNTEIMTKPFTLEMLGNRTRELISVLTRISHAGSASGL